MNYSQTKHILNKLLNESQFCEFDREILHENNRLIPFKYWRQEGKYRINELKAVLNLTKKCLSYKDYHLQLTQEQFEWIQLGILVNR